MGEFIIDISFYQTIEVTFHLLEKHITKEINNLVFTIVCYS